MAHISLQTLSIFSLLSGRSLAFLIKGMIVYYLFGYIYTISVYDPERIYVFINDFKFIADWIIPSDYTYSTDDLYTYFYEYIVPAIRTTAIEAVSSMLIFAIVPFLAVVLKGFYKNHKREKSEVVYNEL